ncbi:UNVERIFIED_CONTAM: hypothetical protein GTU68_039940 [Idotea baltica]|nr:hypothetical protein [Idotea baltica]
MVCGSLLHTSHDITVFEANNYIGGHTNTVDVDQGGEPRPVDTGFIVFNDRTYPNFMKLLGQLNVDTNPTSMSFSVRCDLTNLEYNGTSLNGVFAQRRNLLRPRFLRMLRDVLRFNSEAVAFIDSKDDTTTVGDYLKTNGYSSIFASHYLLPMGAAIWSCPTGTFEKFPVRFIIEFYHNHGLLSLGNRPQWYTIAGGSREYVKQLTRPFADKIRLNCRVKSVQRLTAPNHVIVEHSDGNNQFDEVIFACHSDQALRMLGCDSTVTERDVLSQFPYGPNEAVLHTDTTLLPKRKLAWAAWNYHLSDAGERNATLTYNMNILQHIQSQHTYCVTLNETEQIDPSKVIRRFNYSHPIYTSTRAASQARHPELIRQRGTSFCGAYWGNGFHEDGVNSALAVCRAYGQSLDGRIDAPVNLVLSSNGGV